jgi:tetratricopeptide (TPR) repeat protein
LGTPARALLVLAITGLGIFSPIAEAKGPSLNAIELYDGPSGPAYVQLAEVLINGKLELRSCASMDANPIDKSAYGKMPKLTIAAGGILERDGNGVLRYGTSDSPATCVVPEGVKFEHNATFTASTIADTADLRGRALVGTSADTSAAQPLKKGVKLVFLLAPDVERAEYMLAERIASQAGWQKYLEKYPAAPHTDAAKQAFASLCVDAGETALKSYQVSESSASPSFPDLKAALAQQAMAHSLRPGADGDVRLAAGIHKSLQNLMDKAHSEFDAYRTALTSSTPGYAHLKSSGVYAGAVANIDPNFPELAKLQSDITREGGAFESAIHSAQAALEKKSMDEALKAIQPYRQFAGEEPRIAGVLDAAYDAYFVQAQELDATKDWQNAIAAYKNALKAKDTPDAHTALQTAEKAYGAAQDDEATKAALQKSKDLELQHDIIPAYEVLTSLPARQQGMVKEDIDRLTPDYVTAASDKAKDIAQLYDTIKGIGDEKAVENAYRYLGRAYELTPDDAMKQGFQVRIQNLSDELSTWFLDRAKHSLQKPLGSGTEIGWAYLKEAEAYKAVNLESVRDTMKMAANAHEMHSTLSIRVQFRDQTSQRQSEGFASQMESAIAAGLDSPGTPVKVIRSGDATHPDVDPDFVIAGDVLEHNISLPPTIESLDSNYIAGTHDIPSDDWNKLNRQLDSAMEELHTAQSALQGAETKGNKKVVTEASNSVQTAQKKVDDIRTKMDSTPKNRIEDVIRPYSYKKTTYNMINRIVLQFRIDDTFGNQKGDPALVTKEERKPFVVLSEVKPEDTNKVKNEGTIPDREELQNQLENTAREELIQKIRSKIVELPHKVYDDGQRREHDGYPDDAGEAYMRYLSVAPPDQLTERQHAEDFLKEQFNFQSFPNEILGSPKSTPPLEQGMTRSAAASPN